MGGVCAKPSASPAPAPRAAAHAPNSFVAIADKYTTLEQVQAGLRKAGLESSNLIIGVDFTKSNQWTGKDTFGGQCLHSLTAGGMNPYQRVIDVMARTLEPFDDDKLIPAYGFGDVTTTDKSVFPFFQDERPCNGVAEVLARYSELVPHVQMSGPTSFAPLINKAIEIVQQTRQYHILVIIADGQVTNVDTTAQAVIRATNYPLSIIMVGVGDGPWDTMEEFDDHLEARRVCLFSFSPCTHPMLLLLVMHSSPLLLLLLPQFDNFQFVNFNAVMTKPRVENYDVEFAVAALQEIPDQWSAIQRLRLV